LFIKPELLLFFCVVKPSAEKYGYLEQGHNVCFQCRKIFAPEKDNESDLRNRLRMTEVPSLPTQHKTKDLRAM
jgi:hypothetical protein